jgi:hypothetical protein
MSNQGITLRVDPESRERLDELRWKTNKSLGRLVRENLGVQERDESASFERGRKEGYAKGYAKGKEDGLLEARNTLAKPCPMCNKMMVFSLAASDWRLWRQLVRMDVIDAFVCQECASRKT